MAGHGSVILFPMAYSVTLSIKRILIRLGYRRPDCLNYVVGTEIL